MNRGNEKDECEPAAVLCWRRVREEGLFLALTFHCANGDMQHASYVSFLFTPLVTHRTDPVRGPDCQYGGTHAYMPHTIP